MAQRPLPDDHPAFAALPVTMLTIGAAGSEMAVHVAGRLGPGRLPVICVPGYNRNMADYEPLVRAATKMLDPMTPLVLVDLKGRGRSSDRARIDDYSSLADASDLAEVARALAIERAIWIGQGYGGQVLMGLAAQRPSLLAGTILIDAGPVSDSRGLVRLRTVLLSLIHI